MEDSIIFPCIKFNSENLNKILNLFKKYNTKNVSKVDLIQKL